MQIKSDFTTNGIIPTGNKNVFIAYAITIQINVSIMFVQLYGIK